MLPHRCLVSLLLIAVLSPAAARAQEPLHLDEPVHRANCAVASEDIASLEDDLRVLGKHQNHLKPWWRDVGFGLAGGALGGVLYSYALLSGSGPPSAHFQRVFWPVAGVAVTVPLSIGIGGVVFGARRRDERREARQRQRQIKREFNELVVWRKRYCRGL